MERPGGTETNGGRLPVLSRMTGRVLELTKNLLPEWSGLAASNLAWPTGRRSHASIAKSPVTGIVLKLLA